MYDDKSAESYDRDMAKDRFNVADRQMLLNIVESKIPKTHLIIDIGGGTGTDAVALARNGYFVCLVEPSESMISYARSKVARCGLSGSVEIIHGDIAAITKSRANFDRPISIISNFASLNHLQDPLREIRQAGRLVSPGGYFIFSVGNPLYFDHFRAASISRVLASLATTSVSRSPLHRHVYHYYGTRFLRAALADFHCQERLLSISRASERQRFSFAGRMLDKAASLAPFLLPTASAFQIFVWKRQNA